MSIVRIGLAETKHFAEGYDAIFGNKKKAGAAKKGDDAPKNAPAWTRDRQRLWNEVERYEDAHNRKSGPRSLLPSKQRSKCVSL